MSFPSFSAIRNWRASLRADSPPPPLLRPSSLLSAPHQPASYAEDLEPAPSEPTTPLPQEDYSYNDASAITAAIAASSSSGHDASSHSQAALATTSPSSASSPVADAMLAAGGAAVGAAGGGLSQPSILLTPVSPSPLRAASVPTVLRRASSSSSNASPRDTILTSPAPSPPLLPASSSSFSSSSPLTPSSSSTSLPSSSLSFPPLPPPPPPLQLPPPPRLSPPALQATLILAYCRAWLLANEEYELRSRLNHTATDKHALKVRLHQSLQRFQAEDGKISTTLDGLQREEERLRRELDAVTGQLQSRQQQRAKKAVAAPLSTAPPAPSPSPPLPSSGAPLAPAQQLQPKGASAALREQRAALWQSIEQLIHRRNAHRSGLLTVRQSCSCITQALWQTHISLRERYTQFSAFPDSQPDIDTTTIAETPQKPATAASASPSASPGSRISLRRKAGSSQAASVISSPQAPSSPRDSGSLSAGGGDSVRFVSNVDDWVLNAVNRLNSLRTSEGELQKRLDRLNVKRQQIASYFDRIAAFTKSRQAEQTAAAAAAGQDGKERASADRRKRNSEVETGAGAVAGGAGSGLSQLVRQWSLRGVTQAQEEADAAARLESEQLTALVFEHRNRKILHRVVETIENSGLLQSRRLQSGLHPQCILGSELILWFGRSNLVPHRVDALELIDLLLRSGLLQDVGDDELAASASADEWELGSSFAAEHLRRRVFVLGGRGGGRRLEDLVKSGWMDKIGRFRSYARFFSWDGDLQRLACYESNSNDAQLMRTYWLDADTAVHALDSRLQSQQSAAASASGTPGGGSDGKAAAVGVKFHIEIVFASQQSGESSLVLAVHSEQERRDWMRLLRLPFTETDSAQSMGGQQQPPALQQKRDSKSGAEVMQGLSLRTPALPPSFSFAADATGFPSSSLNPTAFAHPALLHPPALTSAGDADSEDSLHERSMPELQREQLRLSEFAVSRAKSAMWLQSAMTAMEAKAELDLGLVDILNDYDDADDEAEAAAAAAAASSEGEEEQPGLTQQTPLKARRTGAGQRLQAVAEERGEGEDDDTDAVYDFEEEDEEDAAEDEAAEDDDDIDPGQLAFPSSARSLPQDDAYSASRKQQRRRKTLRAIDRINALLREEASPLGRLLSVFIKLFRSLYSHALDIDTDGKQAAATAAVGLSPHSASLYSSLSFHGASASVLPSRTQSVTQDRGTPPSHSPHQSSSNISTPSASFSPFSSTGLPSSLSPSLSYYSLYPRHVRHVLKSAKEDVDCFLQQLLRLVSAHLQPDPFQSDPRLQSLLSSSSSSSPQLVQYVPSQQYIAGAKANSVLAPIQSVASASGSASSSLSPSSPLQRALLLREKNRDVASMLAGCRRALQRHVFAAVSDVLLPIYAVKHAQRDRDAEARMLTMRDVDWERFGLSHELLLPGMRSRAEERKEGAGEEGESSRRAAAGGGLLTDEFNAAAHEEREEGGGGETGAPAVSELDTSFLPLDLSMSVPGSSASAESAASSFGSAAAPYHHAVKQLQALSAIADPYDKLSCVLRVARAICRSVDDARERQAVVINADDLLLLFAFLIITVSNNRAVAAADTASLSASSTSSPSSSSPPPPLCAWHAHLSMMSDYLTDKQRCMLRGYYLATIQAALELIMTTEFRPSQQQSSALAELEGSPSSLQLSPSDSASSTTSSSSFSSQGSLDGAAGGGGTPEEDCGELVVIVQ